MRLARLFNLTAESSVVGRSSPMQQRNICVVLGCIAEKLAGPNSIAILTRGTLSYLMANLVSHTFLLFIHGVAGSENSYNSFGNACLFFLLNNSILEL